MILDRLYPNILRSRTFFIAQRLQLNWIDAFTYCQSNGLRLAQPKDKSELIAITFSYFLANPDNRNDLLIDGSIVDNSSCLMIDTDVSDARELLRNVSCTQQELPFLCERENSTELESDLRPVQGESQTRLLKHIGSKCESEIKNRESKFINIFCFRPQTSMTTSRERLRRNILSATSISSFPWQTLSESATAWT